MKPPRIFLLLSAVLFICCRMSASDGNVVISRMTETYTLKAGKNGRLSEVRAVTSRTYEARRADGHVLAYEFYSSETPITKATTPGVKPVYKSMESDNIIYAVDVTDLPPFEDEDYAAPAISTAPRMIVSDMFPTISDLYAFNRSHIDDSEPEPEVAELARSITASCGDDLGRNHVAYDVTVELPDLVEELGPDAMTFAVGRIFGNHTRLVDVERNRIFDAVLNAPYQEMRSLTIKVPEGYAIDPTSLENIAVSKRTPVGMFSVSSAVDPDSGDVTLNVLLRVGTQVVPLDHWGEFLEVLDAAADFSEARLVLTKN